MLKLQREGRVLVSDYQVNLSPSSQCLQRATTLAVSEILLAFSPLGCWWPWGGRMNSTGLSVHISNIQTFFLFKTHPRIVDNPFVCLPPGTGAAVGTFSVILLSLDSLRSSSYIESKRNQIYSLPPCFCISNFPWLDSISEGYSMSYIILFSLTLSDLQGDW